MNHGRTRSLLVASEIALALVLVAGAGLLMRSFWRVLNIDLGYAPEHVLTAEVPDAGGPSQNPRLRPHGCSAAFSTASSRTIL